MTRRGNVKKIILDFAKAVCEEKEETRWNTTKSFGGVSGIYETAARQKH